MRITPPKSHFSWTRFHEVEVRNKVIPMLDEDRISCWSVTRALYLKQ